MMSKADTVFYRCFDFLSKLSKTETTFQEIEDYVLPKELSTETVKGRNNSELSTVLSVLYNIGSLVDSKSKKANKQITVQDDRIFKLPVEIAHKAFRKFLDSNKNDNLPDACKGRNSVVYYKYRLLDPALQKELSSMGILNKSYLARVEMLLREKIGTPSITTPTIDKLAQSKKLLRHLALKKAVENTLEDGNEETMKILLAKLNPLELLDVL